MNLSDIGKFVAKIAPQLGMALTSPAGAALAIGNVVASAFGGDVKKPDDLIEKIKADPEQQIKLLQIQKDNELQCKRIIADMYNMQLTHDEELYKSDVQDRDSARKANNINGRDLFPSLLACLVVLGFYGAIVAIMAVKQDADDRDILYMMLGVLGTAFVSIINYYFGSSAGSRNKDVSLSNITKSLKKV